MQCLRPKNLTVRGKLNMYFQANNGFPTHDASPGRRLCQSVSRGIVPLTSTEVLAKGGGDKLHSHGQTLGETTGIDIAGSPAKLVGTVNKSC